MNTVQIKICGITNFDDALASAEAGADWLGFIFVSHTPRFISSEKARDIIIALKQKNVASRLVGVFADESVEKMRSIIEYAQLDRAQLHGNEPFQVLQEMGSTSWKALRPRNEQELQDSMARYRKGFEHHEPAFLLDSFDSRKIGGTGTCGNWGFAAILARRYPIFLAGGLTPENVAQAINTVSPWGVDVSSGVEKEAGIKDHFKVRQFCKVAKGISL